MWLLVELTIVPVLVILWIISASLFANFGVGPVFLVFTLVSFIVLILRALLQFLWRLETEAGIHDEAHSK
jgi:hypothetical protein